MDAALCRAYLQCQVISIQKKRIRKSLFLLARQADKKHSSKGKTKINEGEKIRW